ncbi:MULTISPECIES: hypothetical protein [unclassified Oceanispirochaeta]|uniref:hypothetical protein n=1 Tax=unclassified Oceanispirochaeta TaxID=2635722 RepID=UPI000E093970|nr:MULTISPECIES: hypothetical protein [unclassified Oceanispirochaeta]MBF9015552.1 hypothetical protein [Oceanispirochaeta sp. M2]NPD73959.1 hypothetical protein [Oceanispirochaeta sp. M1]RDG30269.1 hypothetical protein DV872_17835 [Oceanispirochaeta sp. M1]
MNSGRSTFQHDLRLPLLIFFLLPVLFLHGEDLPVNNFRIEKVIYESDGNTSSNALEKVLIWDYEHVFKSTYELNAYIQKQKNILVNKKIYKSVLTSYKNIYEDNFLTTVEITVSLVESWTLLPLPIYKYDDNLGMIMGLNMDYKNVGGSLTDFTTIFYYSEVKSEITSDWMNVRAGPYLMDFRFNQLWETVKAADDDGDTNLIYDYIQSTLRVSMKFPITEHLSYYTRPILRWPYNYEFEYNDTGHDDDYFSSSGLIPAYNHMVEWDDVNWIGNLRQGLDASIENQIEYDVNDNKINLWIDGMFKSYIYTPFFNYSSRISSFYYYNDFKRNAGDRLRGILDYKLSGHIGAFWNQSFPINIVTIKKVTALQLVPFVDMGFVISTGENLRSEDIQYTSGLSLILFPVFLPSFSLSFDYGINLRDFSERELRIDSILYF